MMKQQLFSKVWARRQRVRRPSVFHRKPRLPLSLAVAALAGPAWSQSTVPESVSSPAEAATCPPPDGTRPDPALVITDAFVLERFSLERVLTRLIARAQGEQQTSSELYQRLFDSMETRENGKFSGPHCDDLVPPSINGFAIDCPRKEARLKDSPPNTFVPVALFNRFDLHAADGSDCGEYRIVYAMQPFAIDNRAFINFEAVLPNPRPERGLEGCRQVVRFWQGLKGHDIATRRGRTALATGLERFYFDGLPGFEPVIEPTHYGLEQTQSCETRSEAAGRGQIRTNMFVGANEPTDTWLLRQFALARSCAGQSCRLAFEAAAVGNNPFPQLFDASQSLPEVADFEADFIGQVASLANDDLNQMSMRFDRRFDAGQSTSSGVGDHYLLHAANGPANGAKGFVEAIRSELARLGRSDLGPTDIVERAVTQTCAGCHQLSTTRALSHNGSAGPFWPATRPPSEDTTGGFVHVDEHGLLSPALWCTFLPFRKSLLDEFERSAP